MYQLHLINGNDYILLTTLQLFFLGICAKETSEYEKS